MSDKYWVFEEVEKKFFLPEFLILKKDPENIGQLLRCLRIRNRSKTTLTPHILQRGNQFEFVTLYQNRRHKAVERYAFMSICEKPVEEVMPILTLAKDLDDCVNEEEVKLWLRVAAPVADSAKILSRDMRHPREIAHPYLQKHQQRIIRKARDRHMTAHVYSRYCDQEQVLTDLALKHAFPIPAEE
jgi:hypothetical protein